MLLMLVLTTGDETLLDKRDGIFFCHKQHFFINNNECFIIVLVCRRNQSKSIVIINLIKHTLWTNLFLAQINLNCVAYFVDK